MKKKVTIYYSVHDCGDGSAYPHFFDNEELAELDQEWMVEDSGQGWGESCTGSLSLIIEADSDIKLKFEAGDVMTVDDQIEEFKDYLKDAKKYKWDKDITKYEERISILEDIKAKQSKK